MIDDLLQKLNGISGLSFALDYLLENDVVSGAYGIVEQAGSPATLWCDDEMICQAIGLNVYLYTDDGDSTLWTDVQGALMDFGCSFSMTSSRTYMPQINRWRWIWSVELVSA